MKDISEIENKAVTPGENKEIASGKVRPRNDVGKKKVKIVIKPNRRVEGLGAGGSVHLLYEADAERLVRIGYADYVKET